MNDRTFRAADAHRLDDPDRLTFLPPGEVIGHIGRLVGLNVADIGAGTGYFSIPLARAVGDQGEVFAIDFQEEMLDRIRGKLSAADSPGNVTLVRGEAVATNLDTISCDLVFMANVWHELDDTDKVLREVRRILREGGRLAILDWRADVVPPPGPPAAHRVPSEHLRQLLQEHGWSAAAPVHVGRYSYLQTASLP